MKFSWKVLASILLVVVLLLIGQSINLDRIGDNLLAKDPFYHKALTDHTINLGKNLFHEPFSATNDKVNYVTLLYNFGAVQSFLSGVDTLGMFQIMGYFIFILMGFLVYVTSVRISGSKILSVLTMIAFFSIDYLLERTAMNLPENYALLFIIALLYLLISKSRFEYILMILVFHLFFHYRSMIISFSILALYALVNIKKIEWRKWVSLYRIGLVLVAVLLSLPVLAGLLNSYWYLIAQYLGFIPAQSVLSTSGVLYEPLTLREITGELGIVLLSLLPFGVLYLLRNPKNKESYLFAIPVLVLLVFVISNLVSSNVPPYRLMSYLAILSVFLFLFALRYFRERVNYRVLAPILILLMVVTFVTATLEPRGWISFRDEDRTTIGYIETMIPESTIKVSYGLPYYTFFKNSESDGVFSGQVSYSSNKEEVLGLLKSKYGEDKAAILVVTSSRIGELRDENPMFFEFMGEYKKFETSRTIIYEVQF